MVCPKLNFSCIGRKPTCHAFQWYTVKCQQVWCSSHQSSLERNLQRCLTGTKSTPLCNLVCSLFPPLDMSQLLTIPMIVNSSCMIGSCSPYTSSPTAASCSWWPWVCIGAKHISIELPYQILRRLIICILYTTALATICEQRQFAKS